MKIKVRVSTKYLNDSINFENLIPLFYFSEDRELIKLNETEEIKYKNLTITHYKIEKMFEHLMDEYKNKTSLVNSIFLCNKKEKENKCRN